MSDSVSMALFTAFVLFLVLAISKARQIVDKRSDSFSLTAVKFPYVDHSFSINASQIGSDASQIGSISASRITAGTISRMRLMDARPWHMRKWSAIKEGVKLVWTA